MPSAAPRTHLRKKLVLFDKGLANLEKLRRLNLRRHNQLLLYLSHIAHRLLQFSHSAIWATFGIVEMERIENSRECEEMSGINIENNQKAKYRRNR